MEEIRNTIDSLYENGKHQEAFDYLLQQLARGMKEENDNLVLGIISELMGYCRVHAQFELGNALAIRAEKLLEKNGMQKSIEGATTYLNIATLYKVEGKMQESLENFLKCKEVFELALQKTDPRYISLQNNISLLYQELGKMEEAISHAKEALMLISAHEDGKVEEAITLTNLAQMYFQTEQKHLGEEHLQRAVSLFEEYAPKDPHYFATLASMAQNCFLSGDVEKSKMIYLDVLGKIERVYGKNNDYKIIEENYNFLQSKSSGGVGLKLAKDFFFEVAKKAFQNAHPNIFEELSFGLFGLGSECLGYDDEISQDHDFGAGLCVLCSEEIYKKEGENLSKTYENLPNEYRGYTRQTSKRGGGRVGVFQTEEFFLSHLGKIPQTPKDWFSTEESGLLAMTNGEVFQDPQGKVGKIREHLSYYPEDVRIKKIAKQVATMAQSGQYNYPRISKRGDRIAMELAKGEFIKSTISAVYLLNSKYMPFYKWSARGMRELKILQDVREDLQNLLTVEKLQETEQIIEVICGKIAKELRRQGLSSSMDTFLESHTGEIMEKISDSEIKSMHILEG